MGRHRADGLNVHIYPSPLRNESRILKITRSLAENGVFRRILVVGTWEPGLEEFERIDDVRALRRLDTGIKRRSPFARALRVARWSWLVVRSLKDENIAVVNAHSLSVLPLAVLLKAIHRCRIVYDTHELETETVAFSSLSRPLARAVERALIRFADATCVVNDEIGEWYRKQYAITSTTSVRNVPYTRNTSLPRAGVLRKSLGIPDDELLFLYQGVVSAGRGIRVLIEAFSALPRRHLVILGYGAMVPVVEQAAKRHSNIHFHAAVSPDALPSLTMDANVGLSLIENACLSYYLSLPNKLFEYVNCGVPVIASDFPVMAAAVDEMKCGWTSPVDARSVRSLVEKLTPTDIEVARQNTVAARRAFGWHMEEPALLSMYEALGFPPQARQLPPTSSPIEGDRVQLT